MRKSPDPHEVYRALLRLYPRAHRREYGEQMTQTLDDMLSEKHSSSERAAVWLRVGRELPLNIIEEHIHNLEEIHMSRILKINKRTSVIVSVVIVIALGVSVSLILRSNEQYSPTTFSSLQRTHSRPTCLQPNTNTGLRVDSQDTTYIGNIVATSITDARAGTNVNVYFKTYDGSNATGTAAYGGAYGNYNFTVKKVASNATNPYVGGWKVTRFLSCSE